MSSILDALNKLEQEKAQARRELDEDGDPKLAAHDLVGRSVLRDRVTVRVSPVTALVVGGGALAVLLVVVLILTATVFSGRDATSSSEVAQAPVESPSEPAPSSTPPNTVPLAVDHEERDAAEAEIVQRDRPQPTPMPAQVQAAPPSVSKPTDDALSSTSTPAPVSVSTAQPADTTLASKPTTPKPEPGPETPAAETSTPALEPVELKEKSPEPVRVAQREPTPARTSRSVPAAQAEPTRAPAAEDLNTLPVLTPADIARYGLVQLKVNMPTPAGPRNPQGSAVLTVREDVNGQTVTNTMKFYENQRIQSSSLRLFKVEIDGVGIEDVRTGQRYRLPF